MSFRSIPVETVQKTVKILIFVNNKRHVAILSSTANLYPSMLVGSSFFILKKMSQKVINLFYKEPLEVFLVSLTLSNKKGPTLLH